ncbi:SDR family oxidoreductase [Vibrio sp.]|uniref:SDR family oxidoreductase n=1 Tax=Vibrio sp. TaxID=678 RepID=UPI003D0BAC73
MQLKNKRIVITGGTSGIGRELVKSLAGENDVIVIGRSHTKLAELSEQFDVKTYRADLSDLKAMEIVASEIANDHPSLDLLINNAAVQYTPRLTDPTFEYESIQKEVTINFTSICCLTSLLLPSLKASPQAMILNVNSGLGLMPKTTSAVYCATKGALNSFTRSLRYQLEETNISVFQALMPLVDTNMTDGRGQNKLSSVDAANRLIRGIEQNIEEHDIGKVKLLRYLMRVSPRAAAYLMKRA